MEITKSRDFRIAFLINERKLRELDSIIRKNSTHVEYNVDCIDGRSMVFTSIDELINYPNRKEKQISRIEITNTYKDSVRFRVSLGSMISYRVVADEEKIDFYSSQIEDFIFSLKQWYGFLDRLGTPIIIGTSIIVLFSLLFRNLSNTYLYFFILFSFGYVFINIYEKAFMRLFPMSLFEIGDGIERLKRIKFLRTTIFGGILLAIIVGYGVNQLPSLF